MSITVVNLAKKYGLFTALHNVNLVTEPGELVALLGPSGSGKTTLLRIIAGLDYPDYGNVLINGVDTTDKAPKDRKVGFVFQHYALFKHMTIYDNIAFGLNIRPKETRPAPHIVDQKVYSLLELLHLEKLADQYPAELSGGQRQRVALARSLAVEPQLLLLDEPFGALDAKVRKELRRFLRKLHDESHITSIFVTHDQEEAMEVADRVVVMNNGNIEQIGTPAQVYHHPANAFVYDFLGNFNIFEGYRDENGAAHIAEADSQATPEDQPLQATIGLLDRYPLLSSISKLFTRDKPKRAPIILQPLGESAEDMVQIFARPHDMELSKVPKRGYVMAILVHINAAGPLVKMELAQNDGSIIQAEITKNSFDQLGAKKGDALYTWPREVMVF